MTAALVIAILLLTNALFVAAEFASVASRKSRVESLAEEGDRRARTLLANIEDARAMGRLVSASQIGITASSLILGAFGQNSLAASLDPFLRELGISPASAGPVAVTVVLVALTILQVAFGELIPKSVAVRSPEAVALALAYPFKAFMRLFSWFIDILYGTGRGILRLLHVPLQYQRQVHSPEEIDLLIIQGRARGSIEEEEHKRLRRVLRFADRRAREVMVPRTDMTTLARGTAPEQIVEAVANCPYTRLPVYAGSLDEIVGIIHVKDVAIRMASGDGPLELEKILRPVPHVPMAMPVDEVLSLMRAQHAQMAIVMDEYGGTAGLVTMEDLMEEILGEVRDEFDPETPERIRVSDSEVIVRGDTSLADVTEELESPLEDEDVHTVGGLVMKLLGRFPRPRDAVRHQGYALEVDEMRGRRIQRVRVRLLEPEDADGEEAP